MKIFYLLVVSILIVSVTCGYSFQYKQYESTNTRYIHQDIKSDSIVLERGVLYEQIFNFIAKGAKTSDESFVGMGGPCRKKIRKYVIDHDSLTLIKDDCDTHSFANHQFITQGDSLVLYRTYKMELSSSNNKPYLTEEIYQFRGQTAIISRRNKTGEGPDDFRLNKIPFTVTRRPGGYYYIKFLKWLTGDH